MSVEVITDIAISTQLAEDCDPGIIFRCKMIFFPIWSKICQKSLFLTAFERLWLYKTSFGYSAVIKTLFKT